MESLQKKVEASNDKVRTCQAGFAQRLTSIYNTGPGCREVTVRYTITQATTCRGRGKYQDLEAGSHEARIRECDLAQRGKVRRDRYVQLPPRPESSLDISAIFPPVASIQPTPVTLDVTDMGHDQRSSQAKVSATLAGNHFLLTLLSPGW